MEEKSLNRSLLDQIYNSPELFCVRRITEEIYAYSFRNTPLGIELRSPKPFYFSRASKMVAKMVLENKNPSGSESRMAPDAGRVGPKSSDSEGESTLTQPWR
jgi:hypothetical protein